MSVIKVKWLVSELTNVLTQFDVQKIYFATTENGSYSEITGVGTRVVLVADQTLYYYDHTSGDSSYWYKVSYFHSVTDLESSLSDAFQASEAGGYVTIEDVRGAGVTVSQASDADVVKSIIMWSQFIDRACRQWFEPRYLDVYLDGNDSRILWLNVPIIGVDELYMNAEWVTVTDADYYEVYNNLGSGLYDDRRDPKITLSDLGSSDLYERLLRKDIFKQGRKNQRVKGTFGFVEADGSAPALIQRAVLKMIVRELKATDSLNPTSGPSGPLISETTDGHTVKYSSTVAGRKIGTAGITGDPEIEAIIVMYRNPKAIAVV